MAEDTPAAAPAVAPETVPTAPAPAPEQVAVPVAAPAMTPVQPTVVAAVAAPTTAPPLVVAQASLASPAPASVMVAAVPQAVHTPPAPVTIQATPVAAASVMASVVAPAPAVAIASPAQAPVPVPEQPETQPPMPSGIDGGQSSLAAAVAAATAATTQPPPTVAPPPAQQQPMQVVQPVQTAPVPAAVVVAPPAVPTAVPAVSALPVPAPAVAAAAPVPVAALPMQTHAPVPTMVAQAAAPLPVTTQMQTQPSVAHVAPATAPAEPASGVPMDTSPATVAVRDRDLLLLQADDIDIVNTAHHANMLLEDLVNLHALLRPDRSAVPAVIISKDAPVVQEITERIFQLFNTGKRYQLAGLKDVPKSFLKGQGYFYKPRPGSTVNAADPSQTLEYVPASEAETRDYIAQRIVTRFARPPQLSLTTDPNSALLAAETEQSIAVVHQRRVKEDANTGESHVKIDANAVAASGGVGQPDSDAKAAAVAMISGGAAAAAAAAGQPPLDVVAAAEAAAAAVAAPGASGLGGPVDDAVHPSPRAFDVVFLPQEYVVDDSLPYDHQSGNKHLLFLASRFVSGESTTSMRRVPAALRLVTNQVEVSTGNTVTTNIPRYIVQHIDHDPHPTKWHEMPILELTEYAVIFAFEVFLEKQIHFVITPHTNTALPMEPIIRPPSEVPIETPTVQDVLFGRGGMTNAHPGNRRFRDIIALHRPDYIRATKMDKPNVARRIVRAIRQGDPPGRFMKKGDKDKWYDVGDRCAAEKTSQGLRERSNAEKRQRSALREALRIRREDVSLSKEPEAKVRKLTTSIITGPDTSATILPGYHEAMNPVNYAGSIPLSLNMSDQRQRGMMIKKKDSIVGTQPDVSQEALPPNACDAEGNILVTDYDILCGRGGLTNHHKGNKRFRDIVALHRPDYVRAPKIQKPSVARVIVRAIRNGDPPGRFLKKNDDTGKWYDIGDKRAAEKTSQALREKAIDERNARANTASAALINPTLLAGTVPRDMAATTVAAAAEAAVQASQHMKPHVPQMMAAPAAPPVATATAHPTSAPATATDVAVAAAASAVATEVATAAAAAAAAAAVVNMDTTTATPTAKTETPVATAIRVQGSVPTGTIVGTTTTGVSNGGHVATATPPETAEI